MRGLANFISWLFLPLFTPVYGLLIVLFLPSTPTSFLKLDSLYEYPFSVKILYLMLFLVFIVLAPGLSFIVLRLNKTISSLSMHDRSERMTPIAIMTFYCIVLYLFLLYQPKEAYIPTIIMGMSIGGALASFTAFHITKIMKISLHGIGVGALAGFVFMYYTGMESYPTWVLITCFLAGGVVLSARLFLKAHSLKEVTFGYALGFLTQMISIFIYQIIVQ